MGEVWGTHWFFMVTPYSCHERVSGEAPYHMWCVNIPVFSKYPSKAQFLIKFVVALMNPYYYIIYRYNNIY